jgi:hypothetical protein
MMRLSRPNWSGTRRSLAPWAALLGSLLATAVAAAPAFHRLTLDLRDAAGTPIEARVSARADTLGVYYPMAIDTTLMAHDGYCYPPAGSAISVPHGFVTLTVSHGPEWTSETRRVWVARDTTVVFRLNRFLDMRARGFFSSDLHAHSRHNPIDFVVSPGNARRVGKAEDLAILHLLDEEFRFASAPDPLSDADMVIYHSYEYRHMTYGHVVLPGLTTPVPTACCKAPDEAWPMIRDLQQQVAGPGRALFVLAHPWTTDDVDEDAAWPGTGFGREYPLLAAYGRLDGFEVVSYSNDPNDRWGDWYDALSSGLRLTPTAGTDAVLGIFGHRPPGGWRMYAEVGAGARLDYRTWVETVRTGNVFVTSLPLIPRFRVGSRSPGQAVEAAADTTAFAISFEAACATGLNKLTIVSSAGALWKLDVSRRVPVPTRLDTAFTLRVATPGWLALRVDGVAGDRSLLGLPAVAHTNAVRLLKSGAPRIDGAACGRMLDRIDALERKLQVRRNWSVAWHEDTVMAVLNGARAVFGRAFKLRPSGFRLQPIVGAGAARFDWSRATDNEAGDHVRYRITVAADSQFTAPVVFWSDPPWIASTPVRAGVPSWWRVEAVDRGGNVTACDPPKFRATLLVANAGVDAGTAGSRPRSWPNPARGPVRLRGLGDDVVVVDVTGRRVASVGHGLHVDGGAWVWDARDHGARVAPGLYWAISRARGVSLPITILE